MDQWRTLVNTVISFLKTKLNSVACSPQAELYRPSDRRLSAKLVPTFADRGVSRGQRNGFPRPLISVF
jgi:hypothetical protein